MKIRAVGAQNFMKNPCSGSRIVPCGQMDGRSTDSRTAMAKLIVAFRNFADTAVS